jgi:glycosyltransferase involved in cell wall biosynthesis
MSNQRQIKIIYIGYNNMYKHKRGVENVIDFQSKAAPERINFYIHWDDETKLYHYNNLICFAIKNNFYWPLVLFKIIRKIKLRNKSIIHSHNPLMSIFNIFETDIFTVHDSLYYQSKVTGHKFKRIFYLLEKLLYFRTKKVHFISNYSKSMSLFGTRKNYTIIPNTSHLEYYKKSIIHETDKTDNFINFNPISYKVLIVRSIEERARIDLLIEVASFLINHDFEFFIIGKGPLLELYGNKIKAKKLSNIKLLGYVPDYQLIEYYKNCDLVLMPAEYGEGFGLPIIEGYLFNKPVIASNKCAIPEYIISNEFLFENTTNSIIEKLKILKKEQIIFSYEEYYYNRFSNVTVNNDFKLIYQTLI